MERKEKRRRKEERRPEMISGEKNENEVNYRIQEDRIA
jgi:hypothetical protein